MRYYLHFSTSFTVSHFSVNTLDISQITFSTLLFHRKQNTPNFHLAPLFCPRVSCFFPQVVLVEYMTLSSFHLSLHLLFSHSSLHPSHLSFLCQLSELWRDLLLTNTSVRVRVHLCQYLPACLAFCVCRNCTLYNLKWLNSTKMVKTIK